MSSRVLSRGFVRDTFNSPLALCLPRGETPVISFSRPRRPADPSFSTRVRLVSLLGTVAENARKRASRSEERAGIYCPCCALRGR